MTTLKTNKERKEESLQSLRNKVISILENESKIWSNRSPWDITHSWNGADGSFCGVAEDKEKGISLSKYSTFEKDGVIENVLHVRIGECQTVSIPKDDSPLIDSLFTFLHQLFYNANLLKEEKESLAKLVLIESDLAKLNVLFPESK